MSDYPPRVGKSENIYKLWETGEGDMAELAIGLYDLTAHFKALYDDYIKLEAKNKRLLEAVCAIIGYTAKQNGQTELWVQKTALQAFGCNTFEEYLEMIKR